MEKNDPNSSKYNEEDFIIDNPLGFEPYVGGLGHQFFNSMKRFKNKTLQYLTVTEEEDSYSDVLTRCVRTALHLRKRGLTKKDVVIMCTNNHKDTCVPFIASLFIGVPVACLDPTLSVMDTSHLLRLVKPKIIFVIPNAVELIETSLQEAEAEADLVVFGNSIKHTEFSEFLEPCENEERFVPNQIESLRDTAVILFSSGTTGLPKGILIHHYALLVQAHSIIQFSVPVPLVGLTYSTLYWISAVLYLTTTITTGGSRLICPGFQLSELWHLIEKYRLTNLFLTPSQAADLVHFGRPEGIDTTSLCQCVTGGAAISERCLKELRDLFPGTFVYQVYGQSELAGIVTTFNLNEVKECLHLHNKPKSVGMVAPGLRCKVVDPETGKLCGPHQEGELRIDSKIVMNGYYNTGSSESFDSDGWLLTGDILYYDEDKCFYVVDRIKEMLKYKSWQVPPVMIEQVLKDHPAVMNAVVVGIPHEEDGDYPMALVVLKPGVGGEVKESELEAFVAERVPDRMRLRAGVKFVDSIPMTPSGKVRRRDIRNMVMAGEM